MKKSTPPPLRGEGGQSMVLIALVFAVLCCVAAFVIDIGGEMAQKEQLQNAADAAALAGAQSLPDTDAARSAALAYAQSNKAVSSGVTVDAPYGGDGSEIEVICQKNYFYSFARIFGKTSQIVSARAVAQVGGIDETAFGYAVFSGDRSNALVFNGGGLYINGSAHSNSALCINGPDQTVTGRAEASAALTVNGSSISIAACQGLPLSINGSRLSIGSRIVSAAPLVDMPDFSDLIKTEAQAAGRAYEGDQTFTGSGIEVDTPIYVHGNVTINGGGFTGKGVILASGDITFNGSSLTNCAQDAVCFYSGGGNIIVNGSDVELDGMVYAPLGSVTMNGSNQTIRGRVIADSVNFNGSGIHINSGGGDLDSLPAKSVKLVQ